MHIYIGLTRERGIEGIGGGGSTNPLSRIDEYGSGSGDRCRPTGLWGWERTTVRTEKDGYLYTHVYIHMSHRKYL